jgi:hypothetical protein
MIRFVPLAFLLAACPASPPPTVTPTPTEPTPVEPTPVEPAPAQGAVAELTSKDTCTADADCTITNFAGCCACPGCEQGPPLAHATKELAAAQQQCQLVRCDMDRCKTMLCKPGDPAEKFTASCRDGVCVGTRK